MNCDDLYGCINRWVAAAVSHNVQELHIEAKPDEDFEIPLCLYTCKSLTKLDLELFGFQEGDMDVCISKIILPHCMSLPRLKSLHLRLSYVLFTDEKLTRKFFSSFPNLESLVIAYWGPDEGGFLDMNLKISLPQLKHFEFNNPEEECNCEVTLHAPSLSSFIFNSHLSTSFTLENLSSLVTADVEINVNWKDEMPNSCAQRLMRFFRGLYKVKILALRHSFIKALGGALVILDTQLLEFYNLRCLELRTYLSKYCLRSIFYVLKNSPNLESVSLQIPQECYYDPQEYPHFDEVKINHENVEDYWYAGLSSQCMIRHLKFVEIDGLRGCIYELKFLEILLKHATVLEKVVLAYHSTKKDWLREKRMKKFNEMLLTFPRASKNINFLFKFSKVTLPSSFW
ncbi:putative FBD-associated F-box protein At5g53635 [Papaver somniferum]|uniref:putative FBD-associated F-box protein At5g53635 n=1 Tax=Papaver somniferum TaxID=3469 RepID=UPI000E7038CE|nr:putative FBD-associated F-box protein At5g53635 [Papaver somniferum]